MNQLKRILGELNIEIENSSDGNVEKYYIDRGIIKSNCFLKLLKNNQIIDINFPLTQDSVNQILELTEAASFGYGKEEVIDNEYRQARRLRNNSFLLTYDQDIIGNIQKQLEKQTNMKLRLELDKINIYQEGGFFKKHSDTPKLNMIGTLLLVLPSEFTGGDFQVGKNTIDFATNSKNSIQWLAFYSDTVHSVDKVLSGNRVTVTYDIFSEAKLDNMEIIPLIDINPDLTVNTVFGKTRMGDMWFGYFCYHKYTDSNTNNLKGIDKQIFELAKQNGFKITMHNADFGTNDSTCNCHYGAKENQFKGVYFGENCEETCKCGNSGLYRDSKEDVSHYIYEYIGSAAFNEKCLKIKDKTYTKCKWCDRVLDDIIDVCQNCVEKDKKMCNKCKNNIKRLADLCDECMKNCYVPGNVNDPNITPTGRCNKIDCIGRYCLSHLIDECNDQPDNVKEFRKNLDLEICDSCIEHLQQICKKEYSSDVGKEEPEETYCNDCAIFVMNNYIIPSLDINKYKHINKNITWLNNIGPEEFNETKTGTYVYGNYPASDCHVYKSYIFLMHVTEDVDTISKKRTCKCGITND